MSRLLSSPFPAALLAVVCFGFSENLMNESLKVADPASVYTIRVFCTLPLLGALILLAPHSGLYRPTFKGPLHWIRATCWIITATSLAASFTANRNLSSVYAVFLLHPIWTLLLTPLITRQKIRLSEFTFPFIILLIGLFIYVYGRMDHWPGIHTFLLPAFSGFFFAITNLLSGRIGSDLHDDSLILNFFTTTLACLLSPLVLWILPTLDDSLRVHFDFSKGTAALTFPVYCVLFSTVAVFANLAEAHAFAKAGPNTTSVAMIDLLILPIGIVADFFYDDNFNLQSKLLSFEGAGMFLLALSSLYTSIRTGSLQYPASAAAQAVLSAECRLVRQQDILISAQTANEAAIQVLAEARRDVDS